MRKILLIITLILAFSSVGFASPQTDYSQGKVSIDYAFRPNLDLDWSSKGTLDGKSGNHDLGITIGLGNNFAFQFQNQTADSKSYYFSDPSTPFTANTETNANQFNLLYKLDNNVSAFVGYVNAKTDVKLSGSETISGKRVNGWQVGLVASTPLAEKLTGYGSVGFGSKIENFEIGLGYALSKN